MDRLLTVEEARQLLQISRTKIYKLIGTGELKSLRIGRIVRVTPEALSEFIKKEE